MRFKAVLVAVALAVFLPALLLAGEKEPTPEEIRALIQQLGVGEPARRDAAARLLRSYGLKVVPYLKAAFDDSSPEVRRRAKKVWSSIPGNWGLARKGAGTDKATGLPKEMLHHKTGIVFVLIPAGEYVRGAEATEDGASERERPTHAVRIAKPFYLGKFEVTQKEWTQVMSSNPSANRGRKLPVTDIPHKDIARFLEKADLRLPTEVEWEYACRAGTAGPRYGKLDEIAWYGKNSGGFPHAVGTKAPNAFGVHDMLGNVFEWCGDEYVTYANLRGDPPPARASTNFLRAIRGGAYNYLDEWSRAAARWPCKPDVMSAHIGLRVAHDP